MSDDIDVTGASGGLSDSQRLIARHHTLHNRRRFKAVALLLAAVLAGFVIGAGATVLYFNKKLHRVPPTPGGIVDAMINRIRQLTGTSAEEEARLRDIMVRHMDEVEEVRGKFFEDTKKMFQNMDDEVDSVLGAERGRVWREYKEKRAAERFRGRDHRKKPPPPPRH